MIMQAKADWFSAVPMQYNKHSNNNNTVAKHSNNNNTVAKHNNNNNTVAKHSNNNEHTIQ